MDLEILYWIQNYLRHDFSDAVMPFITTLGDWGFIWLLCGIVLLFIKKYRSYGIECIAAIAFAGGLVNLVLKPLIDRMRPFVLDPSVPLLLDGPLSSSFPSGHTAAAFAAVAVICSMPVKLYWKILSLFAACTVAFSRMYLFFHFPSDVLVGLIVGLGCGFLCVYLGKKILPAFPKEGQNEEAKPF